MSSDEQSPLAGAAEGAEPAMDLVERALSALAMLQTSDAPVSLTRIAKRLDVRVSVLIRSYAQLGEASVDGGQGLGWVRLDCIDGRWTAALTVEGRQQFEAPAHRGSALD
jgi:hypothetical protein